MKAELPFKYVYMIYLRVMSRHYIHDLHSPLEDGFDLFSRMEKKYTFVTPFPMSLASWALLSARGAVSPTHIDSAGLCTVLQMRHGSKLFLIGTDNKVPCGIPDRAGWIDTGRWDAVLLDNRCTL